MNFCRLFISVIIACFALAIPASAYWQSRLQISTASAVVLTYDSQNSASPAASSYTFTAQAIGTASSDRFVIVGISVGSSTGSTLTSVTIGGVTASLLKGASPGSGAEVDLWGATVPTGTTGNIVITFGYTAVTVSISVWDIKGLNSTTPTNTYNASGANPLIVSADVSAGGVAIGMVGNLNNAAATSWSWTNLTKNGGDTCPYLSTGYCSSGASATFSTIQTGLSIQALNSGSVSYEELVVAAMR